MTLTSNFYVAFFYSFLPTPFSDDSVSPLYSKFLTLCRRRFSAESFFLLPFDVCISNPSPDIFGLLYLSFGAVISSRCKNRSLALRLIIQLCLLNLGNRAGFLRSSQTWPLAHNSSFASVETRHIQHPTIWIYKSSSRHPEPSVILVSPTLEQSLQCPFNTVLCNSGRRRSRCLRIKCRLGLPITLRFGNHSDNP